MSPTGKNNGGFSLIELMLTVSFVTLGTLLIQGGFLRAADMFGRYSHTMRTMAWMDRQAALTKEKILFSGEEPSGSQSGSVELAGNTYEWDENVAPQEGPNLHALRRSIRWTENGKPFELRSEQYVYKKDPSQVN